MSRTVKFPMPNDRLADGRLVVASCWYIDEPDQEEALVLLLNPEAPFFTVAHITIGPEVTDYRYTNSVDHFNIINAVDDYQQWGGDI